MKILADEGVLDLVVVQLRRESDSVLSVLLADIEGGQLPDWRAGAHIDLRLPGGLRQYSLCGDRADPYHYLVAVLREPDSGGGSHYVHDVLRPGDVVEVGGPRNHFQLEPAAEYLFIAGGIGITPILPMIREADESGRPWRLVYGGRRQSSMAFLDAMGQYREHVELVFENESGPLDLQALVGTPRDSVGVYCCGPSGLLEAVEERCATWPPGSLHVERFAARPLPKDLVDRPFTVHCARSSLELEVPAERSLLDVLDSAGLFVPTACREGICGSCETPVLEGAVEHRDSVLTDAQRAAGASLMVCVSRAAASHLVLDI